MNHQVQISSVEKLDLHEGIVQFVINGNRYKAFFWGDEFLEGESVEVNILQECLPLEWDGIFNGNKRNELKIKNFGDSDSSYFGFGKIITVNPITADFGDIQLELGNWTSDPNVIGEYIYWKIERLEISKIKE